MCAPSNMTNCAFVYKDLSTTPKQAIWGKKVSPAKMSIST